MHAARLAQYTLAAGIGALAALALQTYNIRRAPWNVRNDGKVIHIEHAGMRYAVSWSAVPAPRAPIDPNNNNNNANR